MVGIIGACNVIAIAIRGVLAGALLTGGAAWAEAVPPGITEYLKTTQARLVMLHQRVLIVSFNKPVVSEELFRAQVRGLCEAPLLSPRYSWGGAVVDEIQILNDIGAQGFSFKGGEKACRVMGKMSIQAADTYWPTMTRAVQAGRERE